MLDSINERASLAYAKGRYEEALPLLSELANRDNVSALLAVAWINETGAAGERNIESAVNNYKRAADLGSCDAIYRLGRIFQKSNDLDIAQATFERGAIQNHLPCISALSLLIFGSTEDPAKIEVGMRWLNIAARRGHIFAKKKSIFLELEKTNSFLFVFRSFIKLSILQFSYFLERKKNKYSQKIL